MSFDLGASLRRLKPDKHTAPLKRRPDSKLQFVGEHTITGQGVLLDTSVYIDMLRNRAPPELDDLFRSQQVNHSAVALAELVHLFGRLDPLHRDTGRLLARIEGTIAKIPSHRLDAPSTRALAEAGIVTGTIARLTGIAKMDRQPLFNDATLFMQAQENGYTLLSGNVADMDLIGQLVPAGRVLLYRRTA